MKPMVQISGTMFLSGLAVLSYQAYVWARFGYWTTVTVGKAFSYGGIFVPRASVYGIDQIIDWWFGTPLTGNFLIASIVVPLIFIFLFER